MAGGGSGSYTIPDPVEAALFAATDGGWQGLTGGNACWYNGVVYLGWVDAAGNVEIATYTEATGALSAVTTLHATLEQDWHDSPAILVRSDGYVVTAYSKHAEIGGAMYVRISSSAESITFGSEVNIDSQLGGDRYTYPVLFEEPDGTLWLFYRHELNDVGPTAVWCYSTSTDGGVTWAAETQLYKLTNVVTYMKVDYDGASRFDFIFTDGVAEADHASCYHMSMTTAGVRSQSDGTLIAGSLPLDETDLTLAYDGTTYGSRAPVSLVGGTHPAFTTPGQTGGAERWYHVRWNGAAWVSTFVVSDGTSGAAWVEGGFALEYANPSVAWLSRSTGGHYQVFRYVTYDDGVTWFATQISASASDDFYPVAVRNARRLRAIWLRGTASSALSYSLGVMGGALY